MPTSRVVATLDHHGHAHDQVVVHFRDVRGLLIDFVLQLGVELVQQLDVLLVARVVGDEQLVAFLALAAVQVRHGNLVGTLTRIVQEHALRWVGGKRFQPEKQRVVHECIRRKGLVYRELVELREHVFRRIVAAQVVELEVE